MVLTSKLLMVSPIIDYYLKFNDFKLYPYPFSYFGIIHFPKFKKDNVDKN